jgi:hypothetical protein
MHVPPKRLWNFTALYGVTFQKIMLFFLCLYLNVRCFFFSFSLDSANLTVRAGPVLRGILGVVRNVSFYVNYPEYDDDITDYDIALVKVHTPSMFHIDLSGSMHTCEAARPKESAPPHYKEQNAKITAPPWLHQHL